jgi:hypothetical protein
MKGKKKNQKKGRSSHSKNRFAGGDIFFCISATAVFPWAVSTGQKGKKKALRAGLSKVIVN